MTTTTLYSGLALGESPRWHDGRLWVADWGAREVLTIDAQGGSSVVLRGPELPVCFDWLPDGRLLLVSGREGLLLRREPDGTLVTHADLTQLAPPPWNDIVVDARGNAYVGNTGFEFPGGEFAPGSLALVRPDGSAERVAEGLAFPNGLAITPDGTTLIAAESFGHRLTAYAIGPDARLSPGRVWADVGDGAPDGICLDAEGALWYGDVPNRRCVRVREGGEILETVDIDHGCFACMLGGDDGQTLFLVTAEWHGTTENPTRTGQILTTRAPAPHAGNP